MSDLIKRTDAIKAILSKPAWHGSDGSYYHSDDIKDALNNLPSTDRPKHKWIPCTDQLPTKGLRVLMQLNNAWQIVGWYDMEDAQWFELIYEEPVANDRVLAWMELPNTYYEKGGEVNEKRRHILDL